MFLSLFGSIMGFSQAIAKVCALFISAKLWLKNVTHNPLMCAVAASLQLQSRKNISVPATKGI